ncbi:MAG: hypothetical protein HZC29_06775, partial [Thaumarchaeota archaeon]|nr:hypothetical protein [Nitrososphaerota archaeon]
LCNTTVDLSTYDPGAQVSFYFEATDLNVSAYTSNGTASSFWLSTIDRTAPTVTITTPTGGQYVRMDASGYIWVNGTIYDDKAMGAGNVTINSTSFGVGAGNLSFNGGNNTAFWVSNSSVLADGTLHVQVSYLDQAGNNGTANRTFIVDNTLPNVYLNYYTNRTFKKAGASLTLNISVNDTAGITGTCNVTIANSSTNTTITNTSGWCNGTITIPSDIGADGNKTIYINISDTPGNIGFNNSYVIQLDNTAPGITIISPVNNTYNNSIYGYGWINGTVYDYLGIGAYNLSVTGLNASNYTVYNFSGYNNTMFVVQNSTSPLPDGKWTITIGVADNATNTANVTVTIYKDTVAPTAAIGLKNSTSGRYQPSSTQTVQVSVTDSQMTNASLILYYQLSTKDYWNSTSMSGTIGTITTYTATIDTSGLTSDDQWIKYYINGTDNATNYVTPSIGGSTTSQLGNLTISAYCGNNGTALSYCSYEEGGTGLTVGKTNQYHKVSWLKQQIQAASSLSGNYNISNVLSSISGKYSYVYYNNYNSSATTPWLFYDPNIDQSLCTLRFANNTYTDYWVNVTTAGAIIRIS